MALNVFACQVLHLKVLYMVYRIAYLPLLLSLIRRAEIFKLKNPFSIQTQVNIVFIILIRYWNSIIVIRCNYKESIVRLRMLLLKLIQIYLFGSHVWNVLLIELLDLLELNWSIELFHLLHLRCFQLLTLIQIKALF